MQTSINLFDAKINSQNPCTVQEKCTNIQMYIISSISIFNIIILVIFNN